MKKILLVAVIGCVSIIVFYLLLILIRGLFIGGAFFHPIDREEMEKYFQNDYEHIFLIEEYFANSQYDEVYITNTMDSEKMSVSGIDIEIENTDIVKAINSLKNNGYNVIGKDHNTVYFQRWSNLDNGRGIVYSIDGSEPMLQFLTKLEPLSKLNWYYYEEDFNEWKRRNGY